MKPVFLAVALISAPSFADDFACYLRVGQLSVVRNEAPYRAPRTAVEAHGWRCEGLIENGHHITVTLMDNQSEEVTVVTGLGTTTAEASENVTCTCALE